MGQHCFGSSGTQGKWAPEILRGVPFWALARVLMFRARGKFRKEKRPWVRKMFSG